MTIEFPFIKSALSNKNIVLVTNHARTNFIKQHLLTSYPPDTLLIYQQAGWVLGANVLQLTFDDAIKALSATNEQVQQSLLINLTAGLKAIALEGIIPGLSRLHDIPVFPANVLHQVIAEDKLVSKRMACQTGLRCSATYTEQDLPKISVPLIIKPIVGSDSVGIRKVDDVSKLNSIDKGTFAEEFIAGDDITIHLWWNTHKQQYEILDCLLNASEPDFWFDRESKMFANLIFNQNKHNSRTRVPVDAICHDLKHAIVDFLDLIGNPYISRLDFRLKSGAKNIDVESMYFLEINTIPTISNANDWWYGVTHIDASDKQKKIIDNLQEMPIHCAAKSIAFFINEFYVQSLSRHNDN